MSCLISITPRRVGLFFNSLPISPRTTRMKSARRCFSQRFVTSSFSRATVSSVPGSFASRPIRPGISARSEVRPSGVEETAPVSLDAEDPGTGLKLDPASELPGPDRLLDAEEQAARLHRALEELGDPCREVIELRYFGDLSYEEISAALRLNPKTVSSRLSKCLDKLEMIVKQMISRENIRRNTV